MICKAYGSLLKSSWDAMHMVRMVAMAWPGT